MAAVLAFVIATRVVLILRGGQHFFFDETKLGPATEAAELLLKGRVREAVVYTIEPHVGILADGFGYKLLGIAPALLEHRFGTSDRATACFFSVFSALNVLLLAGIARRLGGSRRAFDLTLVAAAFSATLLVYARFLLPYDVSLCFVLLALWVGAREAGRVPEERGGRGAGGMGLFLLFRILADRRGGRRAPRRLGRPDAQGVRGAAVPGGAGDVRRGGGLLWRQPPRAGDDRL